MPSPNVIEVVDDSDIRNGRVRELIEILTPLCLSYNQVCNGAQSFSEINLNKKKFIRRALHICNELAEIIEEVERCLKLELRDLCCRRVDRFSSRCR